MMRVRLPLGRSLFFAAAFLFAVVALIPLRAAVGWLSLDRQGMAAQQAIGSVWLGLFSQAQLGPVPLGDLQARLRSLPLLVGRARVDLKREGEDPFVGALSVSRDGFGVEDATGRLDVAAAFAPLPIGSLHLQDLSARFAEERCLHADGKVSAAIIGEYPGLTSGNSFTGSGRCDGAALLLPLVSQSAIQKLNIRLFPDGRFEAEFTLGAVDAATAQRLSAAGFIASGDTHRLRVSGRF